jgi:hypothetical protein
LISARAGNVIGGGDWCKNRLVPDIMRAILNNKDIEIRNPSATRPWQHVLEPLGGYLILGAALYEGHSEFASGWNFGPYPNEIYSVRRLLEKILEVSGRGAWIDKSDVEKKHEANILTLDITKANIKLKWKPILTINETIEMTLEWYLKFKDESVEKYNTFVNNEMEREIIKIGLLNEEEVKKQDPDNPLFKKYFMHGTAHHLGLDVHDVICKYEPFKPGMILTCEPGIYIRSEAIGIRLENNILITENGPVNLSADIPIKPEIIESLMSRDKEN